MLHVERDCGRIATGDVKLGAADVLGADWLGTYCDGEVKMLAPILVRHRLFAVESLYMPENNMELLPVAPPSPAA